MKRPARWSSLFCSLAILAAVATPALAAGPVVVVYPIDSRDSPLTKDERVSLGEYMAAQIGSLGRFQVVPRDEVLAKLRDQKAESNRSWYDSSSAIEVGRELAARYAISTGVNRVGNQCLINSSLIDVQANVAIASKALRTSCSKDSLVEQVDAIAGAFATRMGSKGAFDELAEYEAGRRPDVSVDEPRPVRPPRPVEPPTPVEPPAPVAPPAPVDTRPPPAAPPPPPPPEEPEHVGRFFLALGFSTAHLFDDTGLEEGTADFLGVRGNLDWRIGGGFMLGTFFSYAAEVETEQGFWDWGGRLGGLIRIGSMLRLYPYAKFGIEGTDLYDEAGYADYAVGVFGGAGLEVQVMFLRFLGLKADVAFAYHYLAVVDADYAGEWSGAGLDFSLGVLFAF